MRSAARIFGSLLVAALLAGWWWRGLLSLPPSKPAPDQIHPDLQMTRLEHGDFPVLVRRGKPGPWTALHDPVASPLTLGPTLADAIETLRDASRINIFVNWRELERAKIDRGIPVSCEVGGKTVGQAVSDLLAACSTTQGKLGFIVDEAVITISTVEDLQGNVVTRVYDVRDLLMRELPENRPQLQFQAGGGKTLFFTPPPDPSPMRRPIPGSLGRWMLDDLVAHVQRVDPKSWRENGGEIGSVRELSGQLIVTQTRSNQTRIVYELSRMRWRHDAMQFLVRAAAVVIGAATISIAIELLLRLNRRRQWARFNLCPQCGYDLRATPQRCPECGRVVTPTHAG